MYTGTDSNVILSFSITWLVVLTPPLLIKLFRRRPFGKIASAAIATGLYFFDIVVLTLLGSQDKHHTALFLGAVFTFMFLRSHAYRNPYQTALDQRKRLGYED